MHKKSLKNSKINLKSINFFVLMAIASNHFLHVIKILSISNQSLNIPWPGRQIISNIYSYRNTLKSDLVGLSYSQSPYEILTTILAHTLPNDTAVLLATYSVLNSILIISILFLAYLVTVYFTEMLGDPNHLNYEFRKNVRIVAGAIIILKYFTISILKEYLWYNEAIPHLEQLLIPYIAGWDFPANFHINPSGISILIIFTSLLIVLKQGSEWLNFKILQVKINWTVALILLLAATFIHPVVPLIEISLLFILFIITKSYSYKNLTHLILIVLLWGFSIAFINHLYPQDFVDNTTFNEIYVSRHKHHYLPSFYLIKWSTLHTTVAFLALTLLVSRTQLFFAKKITALAFTGIAIFLVINGIQFITVETANSKIFTKLGLTRILTITSFIYLVILTFIIATLLGVKDAKSKLLASLWLLRNKALEILYICINIVNNRVSKFILVAIASIFLIAVFNIISKRSEIRPEATIAKYIKAQGFKETTQAIIDTSDGSNFWEWRLLIREVGQVPVFYDYYFPFSEAGALTWHHRKKITEKFLKCINIKNNLAQCAKFNTPIILVSKKYYPEDKEAFKINYKSYANLILRVYVLLPNASEKTNNTKSS